MESERKQCSHCEKNGQVKDDCWHLIPGKVHLLQRQVNKIFVKVNGITCKGYIDTGSQINVVFKNLNVTLEASKLLIKAIRIDAFIPRGVSYVTGNRKLTLKMFL